MTGRCFSLRQSGPEVVDPINPEGTDGQTYINTLFNKKADVDASFHMLLFTFSLVLFCITFKCENAVFSKVF